MKTYQEYLEQTGEFGTVIQVNHPIVVVEGLPGAHPSEVVLFQTGQMGEVFNLNKDTVEILVFSKDAIPTGVEATRTGELLSIPVGEELLGSIINPLGKTLSGTTLPPDLVHKEIEQEPPGIVPRSRITNPLTTGVSVVDMLIPIGKGQRELVIGDRKTGKTAFLLTTIKTQVNEGSIAIYAAIGKKKSDIKQLEEYFKANNIANKVIIVATSSNDSPSLTYLTPYTAMTIAEYFKDQGKDTVVVLDDLSTHAKFYRELSLLAKNFPGRDSYPGDIFHTHARLLERSGNFSHPTRGQVALTCLPVVETVEGDVTSYIATNIMSMTDGHIFFDSNAYNQGRRPAVNISLSVTRVGKQTQTPTQRSANREALAFLTFFDKMQNLSHFGAELTDNIKSILTTGDKITLFFDQPEDMVIPPVVQLILFALLWQDTFDNDKELITHARDSLIAAAHDEKTHAFFTSLVGGDTFNTLLSNVAAHKDELLALCKIPKQ